MPNHPTGVVPPEYRGAIRRRERRDGYRVLRTWLYATPNEGVVRKTIGHLSFMITSVLLGWRASGPADVVVVSSPTFFAIGAGWLLARLKRARLVVEVRDLWPAIFTELGVLTSRPVIRLLERLELAAYAAADTVVVVSDGFRANLIGRGVPAGKVHTIRNGVRPGEFDPGAPPDPRLRARLGAGPADCLVLYAGTHGISQGLTSVADAAARLTGEERSGSRSSARARTSSGCSTGSPSSGCATSPCCPACRTSRSRRCWPRPTSAWSRCATCRCSRRSSRRRCSSTSRRASPWWARWPARPRRSCARQAPWSCRRRTARPWRAAIRTLAADPQRRQEMGRQGRCYVEKYFDRETLARQYRKLLDSPGGRR